MNVSEMPKGWDQIVEERGGSILQSQIWAEFQSSLGREVVWDQSDDWCWSGVIRRSRGLSYLMVSYGPSVVSSEAGDTALKSITDFARSSKLDFVRIEPMTQPAAQAIVKSGGRQIKEMQPQHTRIVDLSQSTEDLRHELSSGHRNSINGVARRGLQINQSTDYGDFEQFLRMLDDTAKNSKVRFFDQKYYESIWKTLIMSNHASFYIAKTATEPIAAAIFYDWGHTRYYAHAAAYQRLNRQLGASAPLVWQAMIDAKTAGAKLFDLWGVAPEGASNHPWAGITTFKNSFGGEIVSYIGTWDIPINKPKYNLYSLYRKLRGLD